MCNSFFQRLIIRGQLEREKKMHVCMWSDIYEVLLIQTIVVDEGAQETSKPGNNSPMCSVLIAKTIVKY